jgi:hypothetical protein
VNAVRLLVLTFGDETTASTKFRIIQYRNFFADEGIICDLRPAKGFHAFETLPQYDAVLIQKTLLPVAAVRKIRKATKRLLYDCDDLIWLSPRRRHGFLTRMRNANRLRATAASADLCLAANSVIAGALETNGGRATIIPMALDGRIWQEPVRKAGPLAVGWSGAPKNLVFLGEILPQLRQVQRRFPKVTWLFHSGADPCFTDFTYTHLPFVTGREHEAVSRFHISLLPLPDDPFVRGKSPIKALQYFACGAAVAGSPVGATREILRDGENCLWAREPDQWGSVLERLITDVALRQRLSAAGRRTFVDTYDLSRVAGKFIAAVRGEKW